MVPADPRTKRNSRPRRRYLTVYLLSEKGESASWALAGDGSLDDVRVRLRGLPPSVSAASTLRLHPLDAVQPEERADVMAAWEEAVATRAAFSTECRVCLPGGEERLFAVTAIPLVGRQGRVRRWVGTAQDITARGERERELRDRMLRGMAARLSSELSARLDRQRAALASMMQARDQLEALQALTDSALSHLKFDELLREVADRLQAIMAVDDVAVLLLAADAITLEMRFAQGMEEQLAGQVRMHVGEGFSGRIAATRQPLLVADLATFPVKYPQVQQLLHSLLGVPLLVDQKLIGVLHVGTVERRAFTESDVELLQHAADRVAVAIDRANAYDAAETARRMAEQQAEQLDRIFEQMSEGLTLYDAQGRIVRVNAAQRRLLGLDAAPPGYFQTPLRQRLAPFETCDHSGKPLAPEDTPIQRALRGETVAGAGAVDMRLHTLDGRDIEVTASAAPLRARDGSIVGAVGVVHDQTERNRLEREREEAQTRELAAREVAQQLDQFFAMASHDIRSPVTALIGNVQMARVRGERLAAALHATADLGADLDADLVDPLLEVLERAENTSDRLLRLVGQLFDMARARSGTLALTVAPWDLVTLVREQVTGQRAATPERRIEMDLPEGPVIVEADADRLGQVLSNYLTNALKYSADDQSVVVRLEVTAGLAVVSVRDHGPGLPWEEQQRVWELYHRAPGVEVQGNAGPSSGSLGLGLHICRRLMELHPGGAVGVESVVGEGSTFWFRLPLAASVPTGALSS